MRWSFWRKPKPQHVGPTVTDWQPGDMAECISAGWMYPERSDPKIGDVLIVVDVGYGNTRGNELCGFGLKFAGKIQFYGVRSFRKIVITDTGADRKVSKRKPITTDA